MTPVMKLEQAQQLTQELLVKLRSDLLPLGHFEDNREEWRTARGELRSLLKRVDVEVTSETEMEEASKLQASFDAVKRTIQQILADLDPLLD